MRRCAPFSCRQSQAADFRYTLLMAVEMSFGAVPSMEHFHANTPLPAKNLQSRPPDWRGDCRTHFHVRPSCRRTLVVETVRILITFGRGAEAEDQECEHQNVAPAKNGEESQHTFISSGGPSRMLPLGSNRDGLGNGSVWR